jgi:CheY-like chemotaxis protein
MKILIADDVKSFLELERSFLSRAECELHTAATGVEAVKLAHKFKPDLILLDLEMPVMTGLEACRIIKAEPALAKIPVIIITATDRMEDARKAGADDFARKPIDETRFLGLIRQHISLKERQDPRTPFSAEVQLRMATDGRLIAVTARDLSISGMALSVENPPMVGEKAAATFEIPFADGPQAVEAGCIVVRGLEGGVAVNFSDMTSGATLALQEYIQSRP